jgi:hypothetical protein
VNSKGALTVISSGPDDGAASISGFSAPSPVASPMRRLLRRGGPWLWGMIAGGGALAGQMLALILSPAGLTLDLRLLGLAALASLLPAVATGAQKKDADVSQQQYNVLLGKLLTAQDVKLDSVTAYEAITNVGEALGDLTKSPQAVDSSALIAEISKALGNTLAGEDHRFLWPLRIVFLRRVAEPPTEGQSMSVVFLRREDIGWGHKADIAWEIPWGDRDADTAEQLMVGTIFKKRALLIPNIDMQDKENLWLRSPDSNGPNPPRSYCRVGVALPPLKWGVLCVDTWRNTGLTQSDRDIIAAFGELLSLCLSAVEQPSSNEAPTPARLSSGESNSPYDTKRQ